MKKYRIFISSVQSEFAVERLSLAEYIRTDALLGQFFDVFLFEQVVASDDAPQRIYLGEVERCDINGTEAIVRRCVEAGLPEPEYLPDNVDFKVVIWRNTVRRGGGAGAQSGSSRGPVANG